MVAWAPPYAVTGSTKHCSSTVPGAGGGAHVVSQPEGELGQQRGHGGSGGHARQRHANALAAALQEGHEAPHLRRDGMNLWSSNKVTSQNFQMECCCSWAGLSVPYAHVTCGSDAPQRRAHACFSCPPGRA